MSASAKILSLSPANAIKWSVGSWSLFIAENYILSENRTAIIAAVGDDNYHYIYGLCSTLAVSSIVYGYQYKIKPASSSVPGMMLWAKNAPVPLPARIAAFVSMGLGLGLVSQSVPKLQIPLEYRNGNGNISATANNEASASSPAAARTAAENSNAESSKKWKVRCPFDFTDGKSKSLEGGSAITLHGVERISRHPGLWSFGLLGLGFSFLSPFAPIRIWLSMPMMVAWIGGGHTDSRHRRGMGGELSRDMDAVTSNVPFWAMLSGRQGVGAMDAFGKLLGEEVKGLNGLLALGVAASFVASRGRGRVPGGGASSSSARLMGSRFGR
uniref:NnrU domain-containing protein n=1 Tax=Chaetoceros debilis TaxID=122233 RepID=A0A7S3QGG0_9STRA|mmetsp:Transcript_29354/g.44794  ORF Transcript_29354/g.44794 Transcript_29354/m.44794 type:complete len:327 (+) Transcript_29354:185-1165(+)|eukprot:CAMPEP_0194111732 /NCGR_PEP_ID=MMETSP0150-20130528/10664_1 /TAXON_ID=122233 /ORGANISM="Chaetoceros debilis, Strain MM31A-1" /LENGTH=326 /DNA_ID=CAMNT_0038801233 /DNA_START=120 /DNA_END=1100 /DNA_ORIENTATION=-